MPYCRIALLLPLPPPIHPSPLGGSQFSKPERLRARASKTTCFHPLWAGLSFQRNDAPYQPVIRALIEFPSPLGGSQFSKASRGRGRSLDRSLRVSIPFGRVSVFKATGGPSRSSSPRTGFHPLWAGLSFQSREQYPQPACAFLLLVSIPFGRVSVFKALVIANAFSIGMLPTFPSPLGGSQFSKPTILRRGSSSRSSFHPLWAGLSFQRLNNVQLRGYCTVCVSIPFGRVSVFKGGWVCTKVQHSRKVSIPFGRVSVFKAEKSQ